MARPTKAPDELRSARLPNLRVTESERAFVEGEAAKAGLPLVEYCRRRILGFRVTSRLPTADERLLVELNKAGVNLNQIARRVNEGRGLPVDFGDVLADLKTAIAKVLAHGT